MDEELFFEAIIASERVGRWLADLRAGTRSAANCTAAADTGTAASAARALAAAAKAASELAKAVAAENMCGGPYSEAAEEQGAARVLTAMTARLCAGGAEEEEAEEEEEEEQDEGGGGRDDKKEEGAATKRPATPTTVITSARRAALSAAGRAIAALSGPMACSGRVVTFSAGHPLNLPPTHVPLRVREGAISDGLGARVWALAHVALRELAANPSLVRGKTVLEIGAGTGLLGVAAARLGASVAVVSDHEPAVLRILRACARLNEGGVVEARSKGEDQEEEEEEEEEAGGRDGDVVASLPSVHSSEAETVDGEEDHHHQQQQQQEEEEEGARRAAGGGNRANPSSWDVAGGLLRVRAFDWADSIALLDGEADAAPLRLVTDENDGGGGGGGGPPTLPPEETFDVVLGSEVMYEPAHARLVAAALAHRLSPRGGPSRALLACAGRERRVFEAFSRHCAERGLRYRAAAVRPLAADYSDGILARHRAAAKVHHGRMVGGFCGGGEGGGEGGSAGKAREREENQAAGISSDGNGAAGARPTAATPASAASSGVEYEGGFLLMAVDWGQGAVNEAGGWHRDDFVEGLVDGSSAPLETAAH
jgi:SAM-dependent methyltransferase